MPHFSFPTLELAITSLGFRPYEQHEVDQFLYRFGLEGIAPYKGDFKIGSRITALLIYLYENSDKKSRSGTNLNFEIMEYITKQVIPSRGYTPEILELEKSLKLDGFSVNEDGKLEPIMPEIIQLADRKDELHTLLDKFGFTIPEGHLNQALGSFTRGDWAAANGQLRTFIESLFDSITEKLIGILPQGTSYIKWEPLSQLSPPFFSPDLNEWQLPGKNKQTFVPGFWNRLHTQGPHPGLSDEDDSTFRIYLVTLVAWHYLKQLS